MASANLPKNFGVILFPGFQLLDVCGPLDALNVLSNSHTLNLSIMAATLDPVGTLHSLQEQQGSKFNQKIVPTHTFDNAPQDLDVLIIPGGLGNRSDENMKPVVEYLTKLGLGGLRTDPATSGAEEQKPRTAPSGDLKWILTVCTGSEILARTGALNGRRATTNKRAFTQVYTSKHHIYCYRENLIRKIRSKRNTPGSTG